MISRLKNWTENPSVTPTMAKAFVITAVAAALAAPLAVAALPYIEFFNDLAVQHKVKPQMTWTHTDPGRRPVPGDRQSVRGTIPREHLPYPFPDKATAAAEQAARALRADNPLIAPQYRPPRPTVAMLERGKTHFETYCIVCHGRYGSGDGPVISKGFPAPPSLLAAQARGYPLGRLFHIETVGQNVMPGYATQLRPDDRWAVVYYVRALQRAFPAPPGEGHSAKPSVDQDAGAERKAADAGSTERPPEERHGKE